ncbi:ABC transporter substrate-binding protein [Paenibacillus periandrae]|uniref:ABC transporter substrate-binding protein n=1 Tax=Paenibacillus periandrae TaxID=1761741 RepID=UPI001F090953|nr:ABC transporter substrate-binding protein [Paenibacillus periandrae]
MLNLKKLSVTGAAIGMLGSLLAGCGDNNAANGVSADKKVELTFWDAAWNEAITPGVIKEFESKNPNIKINAQYNPDNGMSDKYLIALKQKNGPDIININLDWVTPFATIGGLQALDSFIQTDKVDLTDFFDGSIQSAKVKDKIYTLPYRAETHGLLYNKKLFADAGIDAAKAPENWKQVLEDAQKITKGDVFGIGLVGTNFGNLTTQLFNMIQSNGGSILNADNTKSMLNEPAAVEMAKLYVELSTKHKVTPNSILQNDNIANRNLFSSGKIGMYMSGAYDVAPIKQANANIDLGIGMVPANQTRKTILSGWGTSITNSSKNPEAAWKFINFLATPEISTKYSITFSARKSAAKDPKYQVPQTKAFVDALAFAQPLPQIPELTQIKQIVFNQIQSSLSGKFTPEEAMKNASKEIDDLLAKK